MNVITQPRQGGKTTLLLTLMSQNTNTIYLAPTAAQAEMAYRMGRTKFGELIPRSRFLSVSQLPEALSNKPHAEILVDEQDAVLQAFVGGHIVLATRS